MFAAARTACFCAALGMRRHDFYWNQIVGRLITKHPPALLAIVGSRPTLGDGPRHLKRLAPWALSFHANCLQQGEFGMSTYLFTMLNQPAPCGAALPIQNASIARPVTTPKSRSYLRMSRVHLAWLLHWLTRNNSVAFTGQLAHRRAQLLGRRLCRPAWPSQRIVDQKLQRLRLVWAKQKFSLKGADHGPQRVINMCRLRTSRFAMGSPGQFRKDEQPIK